MALRATAAMPGDIVVCLDAAVGASSNGTDLTGSAVARKHSSGAATAAASSASSASSASAWVGYVMGTRNPSNYALGQAFDNGSVQGRICAIDFDQKLVVVRCS